MSVKMSGSYYLALLDADWGDLDIVEDETIRINGRQVNEGEDYLPSIMPGDRIEIEGGWISCAERPMDEPRCFETFAGLWLSQQIHMTLTLTFPRTQEADVRALLHEHLPTVGVC